MRIDVVTLFPEMFESPLKASLLGRAIDKRLIEVFVHDLRAYGIGRHRVVDDVPYGGGAGMVMRPEPIYAAVAALRSSRSHVVLLSPRGTRLDQRRVARLAEREHFILICGRYEGVDERVALHLADEELSIGDFLLAGGEVAALVVIEAVSRLVPGVMGNAASLDFESHTSGFLEHPHYTRPASFEGHAVPDVLLSGNHQAIERWRHQEAEKTTRERRPDLLG